MDMILQGLEKYVRNQDGILTGGATWQENINILAGVLERLNFLGGKLST